MGHQGIQYELEDHISKIMPDDRNIDLKILDSNNRINRPKAKPVNFWVKQQFMLYSKIHYSIGDQEKEFEEKAALLRK